MLLSVFFQGKSMKKCPKGYTTCSEVKEKSTTCITKEQCDRMKAEAKEKGAEGKAKDPTKIKYEKQREAEMESARKAEEKRNEKRQQAEKFMMNLQMGILIDPKTGQNLGALTEDNTSDFISALKNAKNVFGSEILAEMDIFPNLDELLTIVTSSSVAGRDDVVMGLMENYLEESGLGKAKEAFNLKDQREPSEQKQDGDKKIKIPGRPGSDKPEPRGVRN